MLDCNPVANRYLLTISENFAVWAQGLLPLVKDHERMTVFREYLVRAMLFRLLATTIILGVITGFVELSKAAFFRTLGGQIVQGLISIACFILVGVAFCRFGWKIGLLDLFLVIIAANAGLTL